MIKLEQVNFSYDVGSELLKNINMQVNDGEYVAIVGKNGAGKSTMLKILCGQQKPTSGTVAIPNDTTIGYLPQVMKLADDTTVIEEARKAFIHTTSTSQHNNIKNHD